MSFRAIFFIFFIGLFFSCNTQKDLPPEQKPKGQIPDTYEGIPYKLRIRTEIDVIAFGSCNNQKKDQDMWQYIRANDPDLWVWLGDNIYADTEDMLEMEKMYLRQKFNGEYLALKQDCPIIGIWDDHDYGSNDGDKTYPKKKESKELMLNFLGVHPKAPVRFREGAYQSYTMGPTGKEIKITLLDGRYFRDELRKSPYEGKRYMENTKGDILGKKQWDWLENELSNSTANLHIIGCGVQFLPEDHGFEKWANFPKARKKLLDLLKKTQPARTILVSGDRHIAEVSKIDVEGLGYPLYEVTSSGLTHSYEEVKEINRHRVGELVNQRNFGLLKIDWSGETPTVTAEIKGLDNQLHLSQKLE